MKAIEEITEHLKTAGLAESKIDSLLARLLEEETESYLEAMKAIKNSEDCTD